MKDPNSTGSTVRTLNAEGAQPTPCRLVLSHGTRSCHVCLSFEFCNLVKIKASGLTKFFTNISTANQWLPPMCRIVQLRPESNPDEEIRQSGTTPCSSNVLHLKPGWTGVFEVWLGKCKFSLIRKEAVQSMSSILFFRCSRPIASCSFSGSSTFKCLS